MSGASGTAGGGAGTILVTGGNGFIGTSVVRAILADRREAVVNLDAITYAGAGENLADVAAHPRYRFIRGDICDHALVTKVFADHRPDAVLHLAAESHVDRSILASAPFLRTNVEGTRVLLEAARAAGVRRFVYVSTDEVYGDLGPDDPRFTEETPLNPSSPYSVSKAAGDMLARAYFRTYKLPTVITRCSNNYGPYHFPEKLIPLALTNALTGREIPVYGDGKNVRDWIYVKDHARGILAALDRGTPGKAYNLGGDAERENIHVVKELLRLTGKPESLIRYVKDRPGHDRRYAIDARLAERELGWRPSVTFEQGLAETVAWYLAHEAWWKRLKDPAFEAYYKEQYGAR